MSKRLSLDAHFNTLVLDYARCKTNSDLKKCLTKVQKKGQPLESVQFSDEVIKINRKKERQPRCLVITDGAVYNFKPKKFTDFQRRIGLEELQCVVLSNCSDEMVFQVSSAYDYRFVVSRKADALQMLCKGYETVMRKKLEVLYSDEKELDDFVVTKTMITATKSKESNAKLVAATAAAIVSPKAADATAGAAAGGAVGSGSPAAGAGAAASPVVRSGSASGVSSGAAGPASPAAAGAGAGAGAGSAAPGQFASQSGQFPARVQVARPSAIPRASTMVVGARAGVLALPGPTEFATSEGWLTKRPGTTLGRSNWDRRYCVLTQSQISYYYPKVKGQLPLAGCRVLKLAAVPGGSKRPTPPTTDLSSALNAAGHGGAPAGSPNASAKSPLAVATSGAAAAGVSAAPAPPGSPAHATTSAAILQAMGGGSTAAVIESALSARNDRHKEAGWYPFTVVYDKNKQFEVAAENEDELERWIAAFESYGPGKNTKDYAEIEGWLLKRDPTTKLMRRRYVILIGGKCWYFEMLQKGEIELSGGASAFETKEVEATENKATDVWLRSLSRFAHRFNIASSVGNRVFHLAADTAEDMKQWIAALEHNNRARKALGMKPTGGPAAADSKTDLSAPGAGKRGSGKAGALPPSVVDSIQEEAPTGQVTFVFTDVQSSTTLWEKVPDAMDVALALHDQILRQQLKRFRGYEVKTEGDAFMVTFFSVLDAVLWCLAVQEALCKAQWPEAFLQQSAAKQVTVDGAQVFNGIRIRMGIHTGQPNCRKNPLHGRMDYFGPVVNRSARVSDTAHGGQVVCTQEVYDVLYADATKADERFKATDAIPLAADMGCHKLKGVPEEVRIWQLLPHSLRARTYPPLRTINNEKKDRAERRARGETVDTESEDDEPAQLPVTVAVGSSSATGSPALASAPATPAAAAAAAAAGSPLPAAAKKPLPTPPVKATTAATAKPAAAAPAVPPPPPADEDGVPPPPA